jgi:hypothetical protein
MKFDPSTISAERREMWARVEAECAMNSPAVGAPVTHDGRRLMWFVGADLHVDGYVFAQAYKLSVDLSESEITARVNKLLGDVRVLFDSDLL